MILLVIIIQNRFFFRLENVVEAETLVCLTWILQLVFHCFCALKPRNFNVAVFILRQLCNI